MICRKCPHHVRHGQVDAATQAITFKDRCGLKLKDGMDCSHFPFPKIFDYMTCETYKNVFKGSADRKGVMPTKDMHFNESLQAGSIADMELL